MSMRFKNGLGLLIALLVFATASQAAVCDLSCAVDLKQNCCMTAGAMDMSGADCPEAAASTSAVTACAGTGALCTHSLVLAADKNASAGLRALHVRWAAVQAAPVRIVLLLGGRIVDKRPLLRLRSIDPRFVCLRV
jgi:hypothetical protein